MAPLPHVPCERTIDVVDYGCGDDEYGRPSRPESAATETTMDRGTKIRRTKRDCSGMGRQWAKAHVGKGSYPWIVTSSVATYWVFVSLIPIYNKYFFQKSLYPYPIATAGIQLGVVAVLLTAENIFRHVVMLCRWRRQHPEGGDCPPPPCQSWILGPHLLWKIRIIAPIGILFGLKYGVTNMGLHLVPAPTHLLLQSTDLVWTLLGAWLINGEKVTRVGALCLLGCVGGSVILSFRVGRDVAAPMKAILINLLSPVLLGLCIATLRHACTELMRKGNRVDGSVNAFELTALKLYLSSAMALVLAFLFEGAGSHHTDMASYVGWHEAFLNLPLSTQLGVVGGAIPILVFQVNCTFLCFLTSAVSVGLVGQVKIIPQWFSAALFATNVNHFVLSPTNLVGAFIIMLSAGAFAINNWLLYRTRRKKRRTASFGTGSTASSDDIMDAVFPEVDSLPDELEVAKGECDSLLASKVVDDPQKRQSICQDYRSIQVVTKLSNAI